MNKIIKAVILIFIFCNVIKIYSKVIEFNYHNPYVKSVNLVGSFNNWDINNLSMKPDNKGHWKVEIDLPAGTHYYKFVIENNKWISDPINPKINRQNNNNSVIEISEKEEKEYFYQIQRDKKKRIYERIKKEYEDPKIQEAIGKLDFDDDGISNSQDDDIDGDSITNDKDDDIDGDGILNKDDPAPTDWREIGYFPYCINSHYFPEDSGDNYNEYSLYSKKYLNKQLLFLKTLKIKSVRIGFLLNDFPPDGAFNYLVDYLYLVKQVKKTNISVLPIIDGVPYNNALNEKKTSPNWHDWCFEEPHNYQNYENQITFIVNKFKNYIKYWQIWNEVNLNIDDKKNFRPRLTAQKYANIIKSVSKAIKNEDISAKIILGNSVDMYDHNQLLYWKNLLSYLNETDSYDIISIHAYMIPLENLTEAANYLYNELDDLKNTPCWITEIGRTATDVSETNQAKRLKDVYYNLPKIDNITRIYWYQLLDQKINIKNPEMNFGLINANLEYRKSYYIYKNLIDEYKKYVR